MVVRDESGLSLHVHSTRSLCYEHLILYTSRYIMVAFEGDSSISTYFL